MNPIFAAVTTIVIVGWFVIDTVWRNVKYRREQKR